ncbi:MAG: AraC family transcriptional regulator [Flavitalea sp.]
MKFNQPDVIVSNQEFNKVSDIAETLKLNNLPMDHYLSGDEGFMIFDLKDVFTDLPYSSVAFRPNHFTFLIVRDAHAKFIANDYQFTISPGTIFFCNPGHSRSFVWTEIREAFVIAFTEQFLKTNVHNEIFSQLPFLFSEIVKPRILSTELFEEFGRTCMEMVREFNSTSSYRKRVLGNFLMILLFKVKDYFWKDYDPLSDGDKGSQIVSTFKFNLEHHVRKLVSGEADQQLRVSDFAIMQNLHENYLNEVIKTKTGRSVKSLIAEKIICEAKNLLLLTSLSNKEIGYKLGFIESSHFNTYFKKYTGVTPMMYRQTTIR